MAELINKALLIYQEAGRLSDKYLRISKSKKEKRLDKKLLRAAAGYLTEVQYNAACIVCGLLLDPGDTGRAKVYIDALEREYKTLSRLYYRQLENEREAG